MHTPDADAQDRAAMSRLAAGDDTALTALMERHAAAVLRYLQGLLGDAEDALDLAQETFVRVYQARHRFRPRDRFQPWLYTIATNLARNRLRWRQRHPTVALDASEASAEEPAAPNRALIASDPPPAENLLARERAAAVRAAVGRLPPDLREVVVLCAWEERSHTEAAAILGTTPKAVESRLYRARQRLQAELRAWW
jgi:RNA polymerase sigma-70 factor (ECF subfamily)